MTRVFAAVLLLVFSFPLALPLLALSQGSEANLPACCRRMGKHHCGMSMVERERLVASHSAHSRKPRMSALQERCPYCPHSVAPTAANHALWSGSVPLTAGWGLSHPTGVAQTECKRRIAQDRSRQKRGPPVQTAL